MKTTYKPSANTVLRRKAERGSKGLTSACFKEKLYTKLPSLLTSPCQVWVALLAGVESIHSRPGHPHGLNILRSLLSSFPNHAATLSVVGLSSSKGSNRVHGGRLWCLQGLIGLSIILRWSMGSTLQVQSSSVRGCLATRRC